MHIHGLYIAKDLNPTSIQKERSLMYTEGIPTSIQEGRSDMYTERSIPPLYREKQIPHLYRRKLDPTCIQGERSNMYTEKAKLGFKRSDN